VFPTTQAVVNKSECASYPYWQELLLTHSSAAEKCVKGTRNKRSKHEEETQSLNQSGPLRRNEEREGEPNANEEAMGSHYFGPLCYLIWSTVLICSREELTAVMGLSMCVCQCERTQKYAVDSDLQRCSGLSVRRSKDRGEHVETCHGIGTGSP
ncbi:hypothetical protein NHX12_033089, partial [Muraenolepis orangiensis]